MKSYMKKVILITTTLFLLVSVAPTAIIGVLLLAIPLTVYGALNGVFNILCYIYHWVRLVHPDPHHQVPAPHLHVPVPHHQVQPPPVPGYQVQPSPHHQVQPAPAPGYQVQPAPQPSPHHQVQPSPAPGYQVQPAPQPAPHHQVQPAPQQKYHCNACKVMDPSPVFKSIFGDHWYSVPSANCSSEFVVYLVECNYCLARYVGSTMESMRKRTHGHSRQLRDGVCDLGQHFTAGSLCLEMGYSLTIIDVPALGSGDRETKRRMLRYHEGIWQRRIPECLKENGGLCDRIEGQFVRENGII